MAAQGHVGNTVGHGLHLGEGVVNFDQLGLWVSLLQNGLLGGTAHQGDALAIQVLGLCR